MIKKIILTVLLVLSCSITFAKPKQPVNYWIVEGTAFFINNSGYMVTAAHVIRGSHDFKILYKKDIVNVYLVAEDDDSDIAILRVGEPITTDYFAIDLPKDKEEVMVLGFPVVAKFGMYIHITMGPLLMTADDLTDYYVYAKSCHGNSGGPVVNSRNRVVGVLVSGWSDMATDNGECSFHSGAVNSSALIKLALNHNVPLDYGITDYKDFPSISASIYLLEDQNRVVFIYGIVNDQEAHSK